MTDRTAPDGKKLEIVKWAYEKFYAGGFHAMGIDTVMAGSGISKRTLYKYFASKEELILAVLDYYGGWIADTLFDPDVAPDADPRDRILAFFDMRRQMIEAAPTRGCLAMKASQEFVGHHAEIAAQGSAAARMVEARFVAMCRQAGCARPEALGRQIGILFQGAVLVGQVTGDGSALTAAREAAKTLLDNAETAAPAH